MFCSTVTGAKLVNCSGAGAGEVGLDDGDGVRTLSRQCLRHRIVLGTFFVAAGGGFHGGRVEQEEQQQAKREQ